MSDKPIIIVIYLHEKPCHELHDATKTFLILLIHRMGNEEEKKKGE